MNPYCETLPDQLKFWDATALRGFMTCPRYHQLSQNEGWKRAERVDLDFGGAYHEAAEHFDKLRLAGTPKEEATLQVFKRFITETLGAMDTAYLQVWQCTSPAQVIGPRSHKLTRNTKRCERAKEVQFDGWREGAPCPDCGLPTVDDWQMIAPNKNKNRDTLLRTILYYCDTADERVKPWAFPDGTPAVELTFRLPLPLQSPDGDPYVLSGNMDGMIDMAGEVMPRERKTTKNTPGLYFFDKYAPDVQIDTYDLVSFVLYGDLLDPKPHGVLVEVTQVTQTETKIERQIINVPEERRAEWLDELQYWIKRAEDCARTGVWPKNTAACGMNGGCEFRRICKMSPSSRKHFLPGEYFVKRAERWNPAQVR
jgi:hypothetical protein